jgi:regulator of sigma E protease
VSEGLLNALYIIPILGLLILVHEFGHFFAARAVGTKVEEFGIGIPPRIKGWIYKDVLWSINWIPFGGFVRVLGEDGNQAGSESMNSKSPAQRAFFLVAGSAMNLLLAIVMTAVVVAAIGRPAAVIGTVQPGSPAAAAGWQAGDTIVEIAGQEIRNPVDVGSLTRDYAGRPVEVVLERSGERIATTVTPRETPPANQGPTGIVLEGYAPVGPLEVVPVAITQTLTMAVSMVSVIGDLITGDAPLDQIAGPIGMGQATSEIVGSSALPLWITLSQLTILLSLNLAILNLLPLPALDGGRLFFVLIEVLRGGKRVPPEREGVVHLAGMIILIGLMFFVAFLDVGRILDGESFLR